MKIIRRAGQEERVVPLFLLYPTFLFKSLAYRNPKLKVSKKYDFRSQKAILCRYFTKVSYSNNSKTT